MSKFTEYLKMAVNGLPHTKEIVNSIITNIQFKYGSLPEDEREEIIRRRIICEGCPFMSRNAKTSPEYYSLTGKHYETSRRDLHCAFCGCELEMRTGSLSSNCGIEAWNRDNKPHIPLKWEKYERKRQD